MGWQRLGPLVLATACVGICSCSPPGLAIQGTGATFPAPLYKRWFLEYYNLHPDVRVNYQAIGSGAGIRQFTQGLADFGASDAAMSEKEVAAAIKEARERGMDRDIGVQLLPMTAGSVVICYNLPGWPQELKLSREAYLGIFLGEITAWNDPLIARANPNVKLPADEITVVRRADGSGTTYAFTNHLSHMAKTTRTKKNWRWKGSASKDWPITSMIGGRGNPGVAALIQQTPGAIGYLEFGYAELAGLPMAVLENKAGKYVKADAASGKAALEGVKLPKDYRIWVPDPVGKRAYPIVTYTWLLCFTKYQDAEKAKALKDVIRFGLTKGQAFSKDLGYIPLPADIAKEVLKAVDNIKP
jgi:phosphate transport system substrate-binding protein